MPYHIKYTSLVQMTKNDLLLSVFLFHLLVCIVLTGGPDCDILTETPVVFVLEMDSIQGCGVDAVVDCNIDRKVEAAGRNNGV